MVFKQPVHIFRESSVASCINKVELELRSPVQTLEKRDKIPVGDFIHVDADLADELLRGRSEGLAGADGVERDDIGERVFVREVHWRAEVQRAEFVADLAAHV